MNQLTKFTLTIGGVLLLLALNACRYPGTGTDPDRIVAKTAVKIADFTLPPGYEPDYGLHALGYTAVAYTSSNRGQLYLVQSEAEVDGAALQEALGEMVPGYVDEDNDLAVVSQQRVTIRQQEVTMIISEGTGWEDEVMRQATAVFRGKEGPALLILREPVALWDDTAVAAFLASMR